MRGGLTLSEYKFDEYDKILLNLVCRGVCKFYQAGTHEKNWGKYQCGAYLGLKKMLKEEKITINELEELTNTIRKNSKKTLPPQNLTGGGLNKIDEYDQLLLETICCGACKFYKHNQEKDEEDFRCGAYLIFKRIFKEEKITIHEIKGTYKNLNKS